MATLASARPTLIIDPGHGGQDRGGYDGRGFMLDGTRIPEDAYMYDIALRLTRIAQSRGWEAHFTVHDPQHTLPQDVNMPIVLSAKKQLEYNKPHRGVIVFPGKDGLQNRLDVATRIATSRDSNSPVLFLSLHFDYAPSFTSGAQIFTASGMENHPFILALAHQFLNYGFDPKVRENPRFMINARNGLFLLRYGTISPRVLIELGNFNDTRDRALLLSAHGRERYAQSIADAITAYLN